METLASNNEIFSEQLIRIISQSIAQAHTNDLKSLFKFLSHILVSRNRDYVKKRYLEG
jgi:hypothetical protein